jgi:hypothetical protein
MGRGVNFLLCSLKIWVYDVIFVVHCRTGSLESQQNWNFNDE